MSVCLSTVGHSGHIPEGHLIQGRDNTVHSLLSRTPLNKVNINKVGRGEPQGGKYIAVGTII